MKYALIEIARIAKDANEYFEGVSRDQPQLDQWRPEWNERIQSAYRQKMCADAALLAAGRKMEEL